MRRFPRLLALALAGALPLPAGAADSGLYVGVGSGQAEIHEESAGPAGAVDFTARSPLYRGFIGYRLSGLRSPIPFLDLAGEAGYVDYGRSSQTAQAQNVQLHLHGLFASALLILPIGIVDLYARGGALNWYSYKSIGGASSDRSGSNALYGGGVGLRIGKIGLRSEYERADVSDLKRVEAYTVSVVIQF